MQSNRSPTSSDIEQMIRTAVGDAIQPVRAALAKELAAAVKEREDLAGRVENAKSSSERADLSARLARTNANIDKLQSGIARLDAQVPASEQSAGTSVPPSPPERLSARTDMVQGILAILFIGFPLSVAFARVIWRRGSHAPMPAALAPDSAKRFDRLEQAVDSIAIEVERISENQRYLTKVLTEKRPAAGALPGAVDPQ